MKPGGKHKMHCGGGTGNAGGAGTHAATPGAGAGKRRLTVARTVEFTNTNDVATVDTTNWFLLIKNLFSLEL